MWKQILKWSGELTGSFLVLLIIGFFVFPYIHPEKVDKIEKSKPEWGELYDPALANPDTVLALRSRVEQYRHRIDSLEQLEHEISKKSDSLESLLKNVREKAAQNKVQQQEREARLKEDPKALARNLMSLDEETLNPILTELSTQQLLELYRSSGSRERKKLLSTLKPQKAVELLDEVML